MSKFPNVKHSQEKRCDSLNGKIRKPQNSGESNSLKIVGVCSSTAKSVLYDSYSKLSADVSYVLILQNEVIFLSPSVSNDYMLTILMIYWRLC